MRINGLNNVNSIYKTNKANKAYGTSSAEPSKDTLAISDFAKELQVAKQAVDMAPEIRESRVEGIRQQMEAGQYNIAASQLADKLLNRYFE